MCHAINASPRKTGAFSLVEITITVAVVGLLAAIGVIGIGNVVNTSHAQKLQADTVTLNSAIQSYIASGGSVDNVQSVDDLLMRLKTRIDNSIAARIPGLSSSMIDSRVTTVMQTGAESLTTDARVVWDPATNRLKIVSSGGIGVKEFRLDEDLAEVTGTTVDRTTAMKYSGQSTWIWDYQDAGLPAAPKGPSSFPVNPNVTLGSPTAVTPVPVLPSSKFTLAPPIPSIAGGTYPLNGFDLVVSLANPNPPGVSEVYYSVNFGDWIRYGAPLTIGPGAILGLQSIPIAPDWEASGKVDEIYAVKPEILSAPEVLPEAPNFGSSVGGVVTVTLTDTNAPGLAMLVYRVNGGYWKIYASPFPLLGSSFPSGAMIEARAVSAEFAYYLPSPLSAGKIAPGQILFSGSADGAFRNPVGVAGMVTNISPGGSSDTFRWGDENGSGLKQSNMAFTGGTFPTIVDGQRFNIGSLSYFNGTIKSGTGADKVDLAIYLNLTTGQNSYRPYFEFTFDLINSPNTGSDPWAAADYVRLSDPRASRTMVIDDSEYEFRVEFGETTVDGFADFDEFFVLENKDASVNIYGTFVLLGAVADNTDPLNGGVTISTAAGTGSVGDKTFQKEGYVDVLEYVKDLVAFAKIERDKASNQNNAATAGAALAALGKLDIGSKIAAKRYAAAAKLASDAAAGAAAARAAATAAETAAGNVKLALDKANASAAVDPTDKGLKDQAIAVGKLSIEATTFATEARASATAATADGAAVATIWDQFLATGPAADPIGYTAYLAGVAKDYRDEAKSARDSAQLASTKAVSLLTTVQNDIAGMKYDDARKHAAEAATYATTAQTSLTNAQNAAALASALSGEAGSLALTYPSAKATASAAEAAGYATTALSYVSEARTASDSAEAAASTASLLVASLP